MKSSLNTVQIVGAVEELNFKVENKEVELKNKDGITKKVKCNVIEKDEFKNPSMTIKVEKYDEEGNLVEGKAQVIGVDFFPQKEYKLDENGEIKENSKYKAFETIMNYQRGTRVKVDGAIGLNEYATEDGRWSSRVVVNGFNCSSSKVGETDYADINLTGIVRNSLKEVVGEEQRETGRLKVEFIIFDYNCNALPIPLIVEQDLSDDFTDLYPNGTSCQVRAEFISTYVGKKEVKKSGGFGRRASNIKSGFEIQELAVFGGDDPFEEENEYFIPIAEVRKAMNERDIMIEAKIKERKEKKSEPKKTGGIGTRKSNITSTTMDEDDLPF